MRLTENEYQQNLNPEGNGLVTLYEPVKQEFPFRAEQTLFSFIDIQGNECRTTWNDLCDEDNVYGENLAGMRWGQISGRYFVQRCYADGTIDYVREELIAVITPLHTEISSVKREDLPKTNSG